jgi:hypothetical protein
MMTGLTQHTEIHTDGRPPPLLQADGPVEAGVIRRLVGVIVAAGRLRGREAQVADGGFGITQALAGGRGVCMLVCVCEWVVQCWAPGVAFVWTRYAIV